jgi:NDP-sugar pyrophosphorylase family protein
MKTMILAAGFGTRLFPLTIDRTKPAIPFLGKPLVGYVAEYVARFGFRDIVVNLHHQPASVKDALGDGSRFGVKIHYSEEPEILGTAGALWKARDQLSGGDFLIVNGKIITDIDIRPAVEAHVRSRALATLVLKENHKREKFTIVNTSDGYVTSFGPHARPLTEAEIRESAHELFVPLMFTGIHILSPKVIDMVPPNTFKDIVTDIYRPALKVGQKIAAYVAEGNWHELSTIPRYLDISLAMMQDANVHCGCRCSFAEDASIRDSVIWDDVVVEAGASLYRTIVADGVTIPAGQNFENAAIVRAEMVRNCDEIPEKALNGYIEGDNYVVPFLN